MVGWLGIVAPHGTPRPIVQRLNTALNGIMATAEMRERLTAQGAEIVTGTPEAFGGYIRGKIARWAQITRAAGIRAE